MSTQFALGTYRMTDLDPQHVETIKSAIISGIQLIDTSTNYMDGGAERAIGLAMHGLSETQLGQVEIVSKFGYVQGSTMKRLKEEETFNNVVKYTEHVWHCIDPDFMHDQLTQTLQRLNRDSIGCYLLHNPEYFLLDAINRGVPVEERLDEMLQRILDVFIALEKEVSAGRIQSYGISSNNFAKMANDSEFLPYEDLIVLAQNAAKHAKEEKHHFTTIQLPMNMLEQDGIKCATWAHDRGLRVLVNRPLNAQRDGRMYRLADYPEPIDYYHHLNALLEISETAELQALNNLLMDLDANKHRFQWVGDYEHFFYAQIIPHVQQVVAKAEQQTQENLLGSLELFFSEYAKMVAYECSLRTHQELEALFAECHTSMQACALEFLQRDIVDFILVGMRKPKYLYEVIALSDERRA